MQSGSGARQVLFFGLHCFHSCILTIYFRDGRPQEAVDVLKRCIDIHRKTGKTASELVEKFSLHFFCVLFNFSLSVLCQSEQFGAGVAALGSTRRSDSRVGESEEHSRSQQTSSFQRRW